MVDLSPSIVASMKRHREHLHQHPEVGLQLPETHSYINQELQQLGLDTECHPGKGVTARIRGTDSRQLPIIFRADMDALPIDEGLDLTYRSTRPGAMHACGHDLHMATLLGVTEDLLTHPPQRDVIIAFQPGEESDRGARETLSHENLQIEHAETFAVHVNAVLPLGEVAYSRGVFMAYGDWFQIELRGAGGHASAPERVGNPIRAGSEIEEGLVALAKQLSTDNSRVVATTTEFLSGNTVNVIPTRATLRGTLRTVTSRQRDALHQKFNDLVTKVAKRHQLDGGLTITHGYPAVECDQQFVDSALKRWSKSGVLATFSEMSHPSMVIEDFSYFLQKWPGAMVYVGAAVGAEPSFNHSATAEFDSRAMEVAFRLFRALAPAG